MATADNPVAAPSGRPSAPAASHSGPRVEFASSRVVTPFVFTSTCRGTVPHSISEENARVTILGTPIQANNGGLRAAGRPRRVAAVETNRRIDATVAALRPTQLI